LNVDVKLIIPGGGTGDIDTAMACAVLVGLFEFAAFAGDSSLGDFTLANVFSSCRNGCDGRVPDRGAKFFPNVERTSALLRVISGALIRPGKTGRTGCGIVKPGGGTWVKEPFLGPYTGIISACARTFADICSIVSTIPVGVLSAELETGGCPFGGGAAGSVSSSREEGMVEDEAWSGFDCAFPISSTLAATLAAAVGFNNCGSAIQGGERLFLHCTGRIRRSGRLLA
jgi:hypothetical protein